MPKQYFFLPTFNCGCISPLTVSCYGGRVTFKSRCSCEEGRDSILGRFRGPARGRESRRANAEDLDSLAALAAQTLPYMATLCSGTDPLTPCFNYQGNQTLQVCYAQRLYWGRQRERERHTDSEREREGKKEGERWNNKHTWRNEGEVGEEEKDGKSGRGIGCISERPFTTDQRLWLCNSAIVKQKKVTFWQIVAFRVNYAVFTHIVLFIECSWLSFYVMCQSR